MVKRSNLSRRAEKRAGSGCGGSVGEGGKEGIVRLTIRLKPSTTRPLNKSRSMLFACLQSGSCSNFSPAKMIAGCTGIGMRFGYAFPSDLSRDYLYQTEPEMDNLIMIVCCKKHLQKVMNRKAREFEESSESEMCI